MSTGKYIGDELELFREATNWKAYLSASIKPYISGARVVEVGAGIGETTRYLCDGSQKEWMCLEPDRALADTISNRIANNDLPVCCRAKAGRLADLDEEAFDTVLYIDVLEHIEDDVGEVNEVLRLLRPGGNLIILAPAHQWLFSEFDMSIGHFRRYNKSTLLATIGDRLQPVRLHYLDSAGVALSIANRLFLKQSLPTKKQVAFWDKFIVPISRVTDRLTAYHFGKSLLAVFSKNTS